MHTLEQLRAGQLHGVNRLDLAAGLTEFPAEIFKLADSLEILNLSGNALTSLPDDLPRLGKLRVLFCSDNRFEEVPAVLGQCQQLEMVGFKANQIHTLPPAALPPLLRWLILTDNQLEEVPAEIGRCGRLQKLMLAGNRLRALPETLAACTQLELLRIAANELTALPAWLMNMPRLSWLAYAGNPFVASGEAAAVAATATTLIPWDELSLEQQLGEGASGVIYKSRWQAAGAPASHVAVKVFKGALTSDGLPQSEMAACIAAGAHPNLIAVEGQIINHPQAKQGLVLRLIDPAYENLAGPPSLASCTRDIYAPDTAFSLRVALRIAVGIAAAAAHLHTRGIIHGDLYAHNILVKSDGSSLLGDFGAACFFTGLEHEKALALQQLETRAFSCLLEELLQQCVPPPHEEAVLTKLWALQAQCAQPTVASRPLFSEISIALEELQELATQQAQLQ